MLQPTKTMKDPIVTRLTPFAFAIFCFIMAAPPSWAEGLRTNLVSVSEPFMVSPHDMRLTPDKRFLVIADMGQNRVLLLDPDKLTIQGIVGEGELSLPHDMAFDRQGRLLIADSGNDRIAIYEFDATGKRAKLINTLDGLDGPEGITVGEKGELYITATLEDRVVCIRDGKIEASLSTALGATLDRPHDVELIRGGSEPGLIVTDPGNHRLLVLDRKLQPKYEISTWNPPLSEPKYFSQDAQGRLFIADQFNNAIRIFNPDATPIATFAQQHVKLPEGVFVDGNRVWVSDTDGGRVLLYHLLESE